MTAAVLAVDMELWSLCACIYRIVVVEKLYKESALNGTVLEAPHCGGVAEVPVGHWDPAGHYVVSFPHGCYVGLELVLGGAEGRRPDCPVGLCIGGAVVKGHCDEEILTYVFLSPSVK